MCWLSGQLIGRVALGIFLFPLRALLLLLPQDGADAVDISCHHRQRNIAPESVDSMIRTPIEAMHFKRVDRRLHCRVLAPCLDERLRVLHRLRLVRQLAFSRQRDQRQVVFQEALIVLR